MYSGKPRQSWLSFPQQSSRQLQPGSHCPPCMGNVRSSLPQAPPFPNALCAARFPLEGCLPGLCGCWNLKALWVTLNNSPQRYPGSNLWSLCYLTWPKGLCRSIIKDLEIGRLSWAILVDPKCNHECPCERKTEGDLTTEKEKAKRRQK